MPRGRPVKGKPVIAEAYPEDVYAAWPTIAALANVAQKRFLGLVEHWLASLR